MRWWGLLFAIVLLAACGHAPPPRIVVVPPGPAGVPRFDATLVDLERTWDRQEETGAGASAGLTASDGTTLRLVRYDARAVLYGPLAFTEIHLQFENPDAATREGTFTFALPPEASLLRFAMRIGDQLQEAEVVERDAARATYERFLHHQVDPALVERSAGNVFRARVYPIWPRAWKEIVLAYTEELPHPGQPYRLPLRGLPEVEDLDVQLLVPWQKKAYVLHKRGVRPPRDFVVTMPDGAPKAVRGGPFVLARVEADRREPPPGGVGTVAVLLDASASRARTWDADVARAETVVAALGAKSVQIACFDQDVVPVASFAEARRRVPGGASDLGAALRWAERSGAERTILVTDGLPTAGERSPTPPSRGRLDVLLSGAARDPSLLRGTAAVIDATDATLPEIRRRLLTPTRQPIRVRGAFPATLDPDDDHLVYGEEGLALALDGAPRTFVAAEAPEPLVARVVAAARIRDTLTTIHARGAPKDVVDEARRKVVALALEHRIVTDYTSMLVLETAWDYQRFQIPQRARENVLVVTPRGVENKPRAEVLLPGEHEASRSALVDDGSGDRDSDGIPDMNDRCPDEPETYNGFEDEDGCPDRGRVIIQDDTIHILRHIQFRQGSTKLVPESDPLLEELTVVLKAHPEIEVVEVRGHTDGVEAARLGEGRATAVTEALVKRGIDKKRLVAKGVGATEPLDSGTDPEARQKNRRVGFLILQARPPRRADVKPKATTAPLEGVLDDVTRLGASADALAIARAAIAKSPEDLLARIAEGRALEAQGKWAEAARSYGSLLDLATRPEHLRAAGGFLEAIAAHHPRALDLAIDAYRRAAEERPEHVTSHRLLAYALAHAGREEQALDAAIHGLEVTRDDLGRFPGARALLRDDVGVLAEAAARARPERSPFVRSRAKEAGGTPATSPTTRIVLSWETDESDLDLLFDDAKGSPPDTRDDLRRGYGPEVRTEARLLPLGYTIRVTQPVRGPSGFAMGKVSIVEHDGRGALRIEDRPFVLMRERASVSLGSL